MPKLKQIIIIINKPTLISMNKKISTGILALLLGLSSLTAQDLYIEDFSIPICGNGNGQDTLHFFEAYNGAYNNCGYKVVLATLFTSW